MKKKQFREGEVLNPFPILLEMISRLESLFGSDAVYIHSAGIIGLCRKFPESEIIKRSDLLNTIDQIASDYEYIKGLSFKEESFLFLVYSLTADIDEIEISAGLLAVKFFKDHCQAERYGLTTIPTFTENI